MQELSLSQQLEIAANEVISKRVFVSVLFSILTVAVLLVGVFWPTVYMSSATIQWSNIDSVSPILDNRRNSQSSTISEQADIAREIILSNKILDKLIETVGMDVSEDGLKLDKTDLQILKADLMTKIEVLRAGKKLISVSYKNKDSKLAYMVVNTITELFLQETQEVKNVSSQGAYDFINRQVLDYKSKLQAINRQIIDFRKENVDLDADTSSGVNTRVNDLKNTIRETNLDLTESKAQKQSLEEQLVVEKENIEKQSLANSFQVSSVERTNVAVERLNTLQVNLDTLRLSYTENYPDIVQLKEQIKNLKTQIFEEENNQPVIVEKEANADPDIKSIRFVESALYTSLIGDISEAETTIRTLEARVSDAESRLANELLRANEVNAQESQLEEMARDLDVTQQLYNDLLTRRENAHISLSLQLENQGSSFKIQEPATVPLIPVGARFLHFALASVPIGLAFPLGIIVLLLLVDQKIRHEDSINIEGLDIPVIGIVSQYHNDAEIRAEKTKSIVAFLIAVFAIVSMAIITTLKVTQVIGA